MKAIFTNIENGSKFIFTDVISYDIESNPMTFLLDVLIGIDQERQEIRQEVTQEISKLEFTVEVI